MNAVAATQLAPVSQTHRQSGVYGREIRGELVKLARNRAYSFAVVGFPVVFYLMFGALNHHPGAAGDPVSRYLLAGYSCFGAMGAALFGIGNGLAYEKGHGWLELKRASPMPPGAYLLGKLVASLVFSLSIALLLVALGPMVAGHAVVSPLEVLRLLGAVALGTIPFASLGLLFGLGIPANAGPGVVNLIYLPLSFCGGLWMPVTDLPHWLQSVAHVLPSYWFSRLALGAIGYAQPNYAVAYAVLAGYTIAFLLISARLWARSEAKA